MEKISSIVPRSRRVSATDLSAAPAVRPGTPTFGRPVGVSTGGEKSFLTTAQKAIAEQTKMTEERKASAITPEIVSDMTEKFFMQKTVPVPIAKPMLPIDATSEGTESAQASAVEDEERRLSETEEMKAVAKEYVPPGSYLDVSA